MPVTRAPFLPFGAQLLRGFYIWCPPPTHASTHPRLGPITTTYWLGFCQGHPGPWWLIYRFHFNPFLRGSWHCWPHPLLSLPGFCGGAGGVCCLSCPESTPLFDNGTLRSHLSPPPGMGYIPPTLGVGSGMGLWPKLNHWDSILGFLLKLLKKRFSSLPLGLLGWRNTGVWVWN